MKRACIVARVADARADPPGVFSWSRDLDTSATTRLSFASDRSTLRSIDIVDLVPIFVEELAKRFHLALWITDLFLQQFLPILR